MGQISSAPNELIRIQRGGEHWWKGAVAEMQGWRAEHEDAHFMKTSGTKSGAEGDCAASSSFALFGVLDGHGGAMTARLAAHSHLPEKLREATDAALLASDPRVLETKVAQTFVQTDAWLREHPDVVRDQSGSTCVVAGLRLRERLEGAPREYDAFIANAGDSRGLLIRRTSATAAEVVATDDHKPDRPDELARIQAAGGFVSDVDAHRRPQPTAVPRLDGSLAVSRGLGDFCYKRDAARPPHKQKVSCVPEWYDLAHVSPRARDGDVLILACDGIFDVMTNEELARVVCAALDATGPPAMTGGPPRRNDLGTIAAQIVATCLCDLNSKDNMTLMLVQIGSDGSAYAYDDAPRGTDMSAMLDDLVAPSDASTSDDEEGGDTDDDDAVDATDEIVGLDKYYAQNDESVKRSYVAFLEYCERYSHMRLPRKARALLRSLDGRPAHTGTPPTSPPRAAPKQGRPRGDGAAPAAAEAQQSPGSADSKKKRGKKKKKKKPSADSDD
ncbi:phosphatase 2C-like domain-containing protein [Pelagophyceae sp. CCMP2097]|nr:phosphatase 2C-like domain-containing protein [Pelagophyceae sp. CCMP2097]